MLRAPPKDPSDERFYGLDWQDELVSDTIETSSWVVSPTGSMVIFDSSATTTTAIVWVAGGIAGTQYRLTNTITTTAGQTRQQSLLVYCDEK